MTWTPTSSPTRRAAAAPASVAAFTDPTSPRMIAVTRPASTFCQLTSTTFAVLSMASAASIMPTRPRVSIMPSASPTSVLPSCLEAAIEMDPILPAFVLSECGDVGHMVPGMPCVALDQRIETYDPDFRMLEGSGKVPGRHLAADGDPSRVQAVDDAQRDFHWKLHVG